MALIDEIRDYINLSHAHAWRTAAPAQPDEPALVSAFLAKAMFRGLRGILRRHARPSTKLLVTGIFTHQTPKVQVVGEDRAVEIGDLLLIHQHFDTDPRKPISGRALLLQAKRAKKPKTGSLKSGNQKIQFNLYQGWPQFTGHSRLPPNPDGATCWDFRHSSAKGEPWSASAQYLVVFKGNAFTAPIVNPTWATTAIPGPDYGDFLAGAFAGGCSWVSGSCNPSPAPAMAGVQCFTDFALTFERFLGGSEGRAFSPEVHSGLDHWSIFVNQMLEIAAKANGNYTYNSANQNVVAGMRGRNLHFATATPVLFLAAEEELHSWVSDHTNASQRWEGWNAFEFTNGLLNYMSVAAESVGGGPPSDAESEIFQIGGGGHVPVLLIATMGDEPEQFNYRTG